MATKTLTELREMITGPQKSKAESTVPIANTGNSVSTGRTRQEKLDALNQKYTAGVTPSVSPISGATVPSTTNTGFNNTDISPSGTAAQSKTGLNLANTRFTADKGLAIWDEWQKQEQKKQEQAEREAEEQQAERERYYTEEYGQSLYDEYEKLKNTYIGMDRGHVVTEAKNAYDQWRSGMFTHEQSKALDALDEETIGYLNAIADYNIEVDAKTLGGGTAINGSYVQYDTGIIDAKKKAVQALRDKGYTQEEIDSLAEYQQYRRNAEETEKLTDALKSDVNDSALGAIGANVASVILSPTQGLGMVEFLNRRVNKYAPLDVNSPSFAALNAVEAVRDQTAENIQDSVSSKSVGNALTFLYQVGMSTADSAALVATMGPASTYLMGTSAAASAAKDITERGGSVKQAFTGAVAAGAIEVLTEKFSVDNLLENAPNQGVIRAMLQQAGIEATEEMTSEICNTLVDAANMGGLSNYQLSVNYYMQNKGMSEEEAKRAALQDVVQQVALAGLGGAISGGAMAGATNGINRAGARIATERQLGALQQDAEYSPISQYGNVDTETKTAPMEGAESTAINTDPAQHTAQEIDNIVGRYNTEGRISNSQARAIMSDTQLMQAFGLQPADIGGTASQQRGIVRDAVARYAQSGALDTENGAGYNNDINTRGGVQNGETAGTGDQLYGASDAGIWGRPDGNESGGGVQNGASRHGRNDLSLPGVVLLSEQAKNTLAQRGVVNVELVDSTNDPGAFSSALNAARAADADNGWAVTPKSPEGIRDGNLKAYMSADGATGFAIAPDGDIEAVFANKQAGAPKGATKSTMPQAIAAGGTKLDCYGERLARLYGQYGFVPVARVEFNPEHANEGWDSSKGAPYIYFMLHNGDSADTVVQNMGSYHRYTQAELDALPTYGKDDYDAAYSYARSAAKDSGDGLGAANAGFDPYSHLQNQKGEFHEEGANAVRTVEVPTTDLKGRNISKTASTAMGAEITSPTGVEAIERAVARGRFSYFPVTDDTASRNAENTIRYKGWNAALVDWTSDVRSGKVNKYLIAMGQALYNNALNSGDTKTAVRILTDYSQAVRSGAQATQAASMLRKLSPEYQLYGIIRSFDNLADSIRERYPDIELTFSEDLKTKYLEAADDFERQAVAKEIYRSVADQIPSTWADKWNSWRYLAMLGNFRTHIRNTAGNAGFVPVRMMKNAIGAGIETAVNKRSINKGKGGIERTKSILNPFSESDRALLKAAWSDYNSVSDEILEGGKFSDFKSEIDKERTIFKNNGSWGTTKDSSGAAKVTRKVTDAAWKALDTVDSINSKGLEIEDAVFSKTAYAESLAGYLKANGISAEQFMAAVDRKQETGRTAEINALLDKARAYAIKEAQKATYRDFNDFSDFISSLGRNYSGANKTAKVANALVEGVLPFKRTPANVLMRSIEYSPAELIKGLTYDLVQVKKGNMTAAEAIDHISSGLTGTAILGLGALLRGIGLLTGGAFGDDDDDQNAENTGRQEFAIEIGGKSFTLDWMAPSATQLFVGANIYDFFADRSEGGRTLNNVLKAFTSITQPLLDMSMLSSLSDLLDNITYADNKLFAVLASSATSYITQAFPTLFGQIERVAERNRESTWVDRSSQIPTDVQVVLGKAMNKLPGEYHQYEYIDAWGRKESSGSFIQRLFNNMVNPSYVSELNETEVDAELQRLKDAGIDVYIPSRVPTSTKIDGKALTMEEYTAYAEKFGSLRYDLYNDLIHSEPYRALDDNGKNDALDAMNDFAKSAAADVVREMRGAEQENEYAGIGALSDISVYEAFREAMDRGQNSGDWSNTSALFESGVEVPEDVADKLGTDYAKNRSVYDAGIDLDQYHEIKDSFNDGYKVATDGDDTTTPDYTAIDAAIDAYNSLSRSQRDVIDDVLNTSALNKAAGAAAEGIDTEKWFDIVNTYKGINKDEDKNATEKQTELEYVIDMIRGLTTDQKEYAKDVLTYSTVIGADAGKYNALTDVGLKPEKAKAVFDSIAVLTPETGKNAVSTAQKIQAISGTKGLTDTEKYKAFSEYSGLSSGQKDKAATAQAYGVPADVYAAAFDAVAQARKNKGSNSLSSAEISAALSGVDKEYTSVLIRIFSSSKYLEWVYAQ